MTTLIDGKKFLQETRNKIYDEVKNLNIKPGLAAILVGENQSSKTYVGLKVRDCNEVGFQSRRIDLPENTTENELFDIVDSLNKDPEIHGILIQSPLPSANIEERVYEKISPQKDVDCFHPYNVGVLNLLHKYNIEEIFDKTLITCTPKGIIRLMMSYGIEMAGTRSVVIGRSMRVGAPLSKLLEDAGSTVTLCHSKTGYENIKDYARNADILVAATGKRFDEKNPFVVTEDMVKHGSVVIDVASNYKDGKLYGDVDFENVRDKTSYITPVPGGVGPATRAMLLENTLIATKKFNGTI